MNKLSKFFAINLIASILTVVTTMSYAAGWGSVRNNIVKLKEQGQYAQAYQLASTSSAKNGDIYDREFMAGWIALRNLNRPDIAIKHFSNMTMATGYFKGERLNSQKAKAGYWLGRSLKQVGRNSDANLLFKAAFAYPNTYYGQLSASELGIQVNKSHIGNLAKSYPLRDFYWHDPRIKKELVHAIIREESRFKQNALSNKKAIGMMQVLDTTAIGVGKTAGVRIDTNMMRKNEHYNIIVGSHYLAEQMAKFNHNVMLSAAAYNAGPGRPVEWIKRFGDPRNGNVDPIDWVESIPFKETREYVQKVVAAYVVYVSLNQ